MATFKPSWTENQNLHTSGTVAAAASATDDIDLANLGYVGVTITIEIVFGGTPDGNCLVEVFRSNDSGTNDDTEPIVSFTIEEAVSTTKRAGIKLMNEPYLAVKVTNNDSTDTVTYDSWYSGLQYTDA
jgi:hypothetical protein